MKSTRSGSSWAHVACALWVPEVSIGDPEKMEPITNISQIPSQRWNLLCSVCKYVVLGVFTWDRIIRSVWVMGIRWLQDDDFLLVIPVCLVDVVY